MKREVKHYEKAGRKLVGLLRIVVIYWDLTVGNKRLLFEVGQADYQKPVRSCPIL